MLLSCICPMRNPLRMGNLQGNMCYFVGFRHLDSSCFGLGNFLFNHLVKLHISNWKIIWLVVWNMCYFPLYMGIILTIDFHIFQDGYCTTNQSSIEITVNQTMSWAIIGRGWPWFPFRKLLPSGKLLHNYGTSPFFYG